MKKVGGYISWNVSRTTLKMRTVVELIQTSCLSAPFSNMDWKPGQYEFVTCENWKLLITNVYTTSFGFAGTNSSATILLLDTILQTDPPFKMSPMVWVYCAGNQMTLSMPPSTKPHSRVGRNNIRWSGKNPSSAWWSKMTIWSCILDTTECGTGTTNGWTWYAWAPSIWNAENSVWRAGSTDPHEL